MIRRKRHIPGVRPTKWNNFRPREAFKYALLGATDRQVADLMDIDINTLNDWKRSHPEFANALKEGKIKADSEVADAMYRKAIGFWIDVVEPVVLKNGDIVEVSKRKYYPPDGTVGMKWMALRQRDLWAEVTRIEATQTNINITKIDLTGFSKEELMLMRKMNLLELTQNAGASSN
jgi:hypothetical protein